MIAAAERDKRAEARDVVAERHDQAAALASLMDPTSDYNGVSEAMRSAAIARMDAKTDRVAAASDLAHLADRNHDA